jgi:aminoglycoside phosphotransferase (APT) family kinase protein
VDRLEHYRAVVGLDTAADPLVLDVRGQRNDVLVSVAASRVWRFPRYAEDLPGLPLAVARLDAVAALGIPAPRVLAADVDAPLGRAHLVLTYLPGIALDDPAVATTTAAAQARLGADLAAVFVRLRHLPEGSWPIPTVGWADLWAGTGERALAALRGRRLLTGPDLGRAETELARAARTAASAPHGLVHGDLGGVNIRLDPGTGALQGLIDWDGAVPGDPAVDVAAVHALPAAIRELAPDPAVDPTGAAAAARHAHAVDAVVTAMLAAEPSLHEELARFGDYFATWPLQEVLWGVEHDDPALVQQGLARYRSASTSTSVPSAASASRTTRRASPGG